MNASLDDAWDKLSQAKRHFKNLKLSYKHPRTFQKANSPVSLHYNGETGVLEATTHITHPPKQWKLLLGDVVHNLRASLDYIAYALAVQAGATKQKAKRTQFPIYQTDPDYRAHGAHKIVGVIHQSAVDTMLSLQPYHTPQDKRAPWLWIISQLDNADKHRHGLVLKQHVTITGQIDWPGFTLRFEIKSLGNNPADKQTKIFEASIPPVGPPSASKIEKIARRIAFANTDVCDGHFVLPTLRTLMQATESVIDEFDHGFFRRKKPFPLPYRSQLNP